MYNPSKEDLIISYDTLDAVKGGVSGSAATAMAMVAYVLGPGWVRHNQAVTAELDLKGRLKSVGGLVSKSKVVIDSEDLETLVVAEEGHDKAVEDEGQVRYVHVIDLII